MHLLTSDGRQYELRIDLQAANGSHYYEIYDGFFIGPGRNFTLHIGNHLGTAGGYKLDMLEQRLGITEIVAIQTHEYMKTYINCTNSM